MWIFRNAAKDAKKIQNTIDYRVLKAAWDSYSHIQKGLFDAKFKTSTPAWFALFAIQNHQGKFKSFDKDELHLLKSLTTVHHAYKDIIRALEQHQDDQSLSEHILKTHPNLHDAVPEKHRQIDTIGPYITNEIKRYQSLLVTFYETHKKEIKQTIERLSTES